MSEQPARVVCFFIEPSGRAEVSLRRFRFSERYLRNPDGSFKTEKKDGKDHCIKDPTYDGKCKVKGDYGCDAQVVIGECDYTNRCVEVVEEMKADPRWPKVCDACQRPFEPDDYWQWNERELYIRKDTGERWVLSQAPVGAMWYCDWMDGAGSFFRGPDGHYLCCKTPGGDWCLDQRATNGAKDRAGWTRTGVPPKVTANPSIICGDYHGWLRNGVLEKC